MDGARDTKSIIVSPNTLAWAQRELSRMRRSTMTVSLVSSMRLFTDRSCDRQLVVVTAPTEDAEADQDIEDDRMFTNSSMKPSTAWASLGKSLSMSLISCELWAGATFFERRGVIGRHT